MSDSVTTTVEVAVSPEVAFDVFTREIDAWYRIDRETLPDITRTAAIRFEPHLDGRLLDVHDLATDEARELGRITAWEPGRRLVFTDNEGTEVEVTFERSGTGTRVTLTHRGLDNLAPKRAAQLRRKGWAALARLYGDHIAPNARPVALAVGVHAIIFVVVLCALSLGAALGGNQVAWMLAVATAGAVVCFQQRLARRWLPSEWQYRRISRRVAMLGPLFLMASGLYAVIERGADPLTLAFPAYLLMLFLALLQEGPARGHSLRSGPGWTERKFGRRHARVLFPLGIVAAIALLTPVMVFGLEAIDERILPAVLAISAAFFLYQALAVRARRRRLGFDPDLYLAVERRVSEQDLRPELLVHHPSEQPEYSGWYVYASEQDQGSSDLVPWSMRDLLDHSPEAADPLREGHGKWRWDRARNAYSPVG